MSGRILIAGGGLAGAATAAGLAQAGVPVTLIERETGPVDKICGEFLSHEAQASLARLGFDVNSLGGHSIDHLVLVRGNASITTRLPFTGLGLTRKTLDEALLAHAQSAGAVITRGLTITNVSVENNITVDIAGQTSLTAATLFLATGKHELRGLRRDVRQPHDLVGFKMYFRLTPQNQAALAHKIALILFNDGYAGLQMVEDHQANLCLLTSRTRLQQLGGKWQALLMDLCCDSPYLARILAGAEELLAQPLTIYRVPYGYIHRPAATDSAHIFRLGDQAGVIPSFTGDGMAIALHSAALAVDMFTRGGDASAYHRRLSGDISGQIKRAGWLYGLASSPYLQRLIFSGMQMFPASLRMAARLTRVPVKSQL
ncbi:MAG: FAD-dependent monooxygenase [Acidocella sp.]|nr:FAD-dependent monooxygenase [Acidocella sp.]